MNRASAQPGDGASVVQGEQRATTDDHVDLVVVLTTTNEIPAADANGAVENVNEEPDGVTGETQVSQAAVSGDDATSPESSLGISGNADLTKSAPKPPTLPSEDDRPCFRIFDGWMEVDGKKYRPGVWHFNLKQGRGDNPPTLTNQWICTPLYVKAITRDGSDASYGRLLSFQNSSGRWHEWAMPMEMLRGYGDELRGELLHRGVEIDPQQGRALLSNYLTAIHPDSLVRCATQVGWCDGSFVLPDVVIGRRASQIVFQSDGRNVDEYASAGRLDQWKKGVAARAIGNPILMLAMATAFSGPLLQLLSAESGGIHIVGDSSTGKTTAADAACSVWGGHGYKRSWRATANGLEGAALMFNDGLLCLDEISECDPREVGAIVYALGNGQGKQRAARTGAARSVARWKCAVLSTGERSIGTAMAEGGRRAKAGQAVRILDISSRGRYGIFEELHSYSNGAALSEAIKRAAGMHYGHAGRAFLEKLARYRWSRLTDALEELKSLRIFSSSSADGLIKRGAARFALIALAGELATDFGITGWPSGAATEAAAECFATWMGDQRPGNAEREQIIDAMEDFIARHGDARFSDVDQDDTDDDGRTPIVRDRAGWWSDKSDSRTYLFTAAGLREATKGFDFRSVIQKLVESGALLPPGADGKSSKVVRINKRSERVYAINSSAWESRDEHQ